MTPPSVTPKADSKAKHEAFADKHGFKLTMPTGDEGTDVSFTVPKGDKPKPKK